MSKLKRCMFIVNLLRNHDNMTRQEITEQYHKAFPEEELSRRSFVRYKEYIEDLLPCTINYDHLTKQYSLRWSKQKYGEDTQILNYLISMYNVESSATLLMKHSDKIHNADIITGTDKLDLILRAIDEKRGYTCEYSSFKNETKKKRTFIPLFLTSWEGRWYVVADVTTHPDSEPYTYALERMENIELTEEHMKPYSNVAIGEYFKESYGIQHHCPNDEPQDIIIKTVGSQVQYIQARPIHPSQKIVEEGDGYCIASLHLTPCFNFYQQLLWHRETIEVLEPECVKNEVLRIAESIVSQYQQ